MLGLTPRGAIARKPLRQTVSRDGVQVKATLTYTNGGPSRRLFSPVATPDDRHR